MPRLLFLLLAVPAFFFSACGDSPAPAGAQSGAATAANTQPPTHPGKALHDTYCAACHQLPDPSDLDKATWQGAILVRMGAYMGIFNDNQQYFDSLPEKWLEPGLGGERVLAEGIYPKKPMLSRKDFEQIKDYILQNAPAKTYGAGNALPITHKLPGFKVRILRPDTNLNPLVTAIAIADIGSIKGSDNPQGRFLAVESLQDLKKGKTLVDIPNLMRPVFSQWADLDTDGDEDLILCEFGYHLGELAWHENLGNGKWERHTLYPDDGTIAVGVEDFDGDGRLDILALMANSDEGVSVFQNLGGGKFQQKRLFRYNPTFGAAALEFVDFDGDGKLDFLVANGDNGDYKPILKANHGIRMYRNLGGMAFEEAFFLPLNGAYGTRTRDFDLDGDLDIAAVSFYPDYGRGGEEAFVYFEQTGPEKFAARTFPEAGLSRWMVLDAGDIDGDGDEDLTLGAFNVKSGDASEQTYQQWMKNNVPILVLENLTN